MTTKQQPHTEHDHDEHVIVERCVVDLEAAGKSQLADQIRVVARRELDDWLTVPEAATLAGVSDAAIKQWIGRGVLVASQRSPRGRYRVDRASLEHVLDRRANVEAAKRAFATPASAVEYLSGVDAETIKRLGGA